MEPRRRRDKRRRKRSRAPRQWRTRGRERRGERKEPTADRGPDKRLQERQSNTGLHTIHQRGHGRRPHTASILPGRNMVGERHPTDTTRIQPDSVHTSNQRICQREGQRRDISLQAQELQATHKTHTTIKTTKQRDRNIHRGRRKRERQYPDTSILLRSSIGRGNDEILQQTG
jgi:hypothetical protein